MADGSARPPMWWRRSEIDVELGLIGVGCRDRGRNAHAERLAIGEEQPSPRTAARVESQVTIAN